MLLHTEAATQKKLLHTDTFTHRSSYTQTLLHTEAFTQRSFYTRKLLHTEAFTHRHFYTQALLHTEAFTDRCFNTPKLLHTKAFTHKHFYTQKLLHTDTFTHRRFYTQKLPLGPPLYARRACRRQLNMLAKYWKMTPTPNCIVSESDLLQLHLSLSVSRLHPFRKQSIDKESWQVQQDPRSAASMVLSKREVVRAKLISSNSGRQWSTLRFWCRGATQGNKTQLEIDWRVTGIPKQFIPLHKSFSGWSR